MYYTTSTKRTEVTDMTGEIWTPEEVGEKLKVPGRQIKDLLRAGDLIGFKVGRYWRIKEEEIQAFIQRNTGAEQEKPASLRAIHEGLRKKCFRSWEEVNEALIAGEPVGMLETETEEGVPAGEVTADLLEVMKSLGALPGQFFKG